MKTLLAVLIGCLAGAAQKQADARLLRTGEFARVSAASGSWLGLVPGRDGYEWRRVMVKVSVAAGRTKVSVEGEEPLVLVRGWRPVPGAEVMTCFDRSETGSLQEQNPLLLTCEAAAYRIEVTNANRKIAGAGQSRLEFSHRGMKQVLYRWPRGLEDQTAEVVWVGDCDGDKKIDLLIDHAARAGGHELTLYLSSRALKGQLVGRLASFDVR
jgi:hypothetical protein